MSFVRKLLALLLLPLGTQADAAPTQVATDIGFSGIRIQAVSTVQADAATLWATLTDYNHLASFVPGMTLSRLLPASKPGVKLVEQMGEGGMLAFVLPDHVVLAINERPPATIGFRAISGNALSLQGEWVIQGDKKPVQLLYRAHIVPLLPPPPTVSDWYVQDEIRLRLDAVGREAERRMKDRQAGR